MTKTIVLHSNRGGVGKTLVALNLAMLYAHRENTVCLIDLDFRAPSLAQILQIPQPKRWMNDLFNKQSQIQDVLLDITPQYDVKGRILVGLTDPALTAVREMVGKGKRWEMDALKILFSLKQEVSKQGMDYLIFDTSPGMLYSAVNAVACSDRVVVVTTADPLDIAETQRLISDLYTAFEKPIYIIVNKAAPGFQWSETNQDHLVAKFNSEFPMTQLTVIPCYCDLLNSRTSLYTLTMPNHPFSKAIYDVAQKLAMDLDQENQKPSKNAERRHNTGLESSHPVS